MILKDSVRSKPTSNQQQHDKGDSVGVYLCLRFHVRWNCLGGEEIPVKAKSYRQSSEDSQALNKERTSLKVLQMPNMVELTSTTFQ